MPGPVLNKMSVLPASLGLLATLGFLFVFVLSIVAGCSLLRGTRRPMSDGEKLFKAKCRSCHILPKPDKKLTDEWPVFLNEHSEEKEIKPEDLEKIIEFLQSAQADSY